MKLEFCRQIFQKVSNMKFCENPPNVLCGRTDMTKLIVAFGNFTNAPKKGTLIYSMWFRNCRRPGDLAPETCHSQVYSNHLFVCQRLSSNLLLVPRRSSDQCRDIVAGDLDCRLQPSGVWRIPFCFVFLFFLFSCAPNFATFFWYCQ